MECERSEGLDEVADACASVAEFEEFAAGFRRWCFEVVNAARVRLMERLEREGVDDGR
jgi:hypothetical protein